MRIDELRIPGITVGTIENYGNVKNLTSRPKQIWVPVLIINFPHPSMPPEEFGSNVAGAISLMRDFYLENSFGQFTFECPLRTVTLADDYAIDFRDSVEAENRMFTHALAIAAEQSASDWDSQISFEQWLNSGIPSGDPSNACLIFASSEFGMGSGGAGTFRSDRNIALPDGRRIHRKISFNGEERDGVWSDMGWAALAHELGHSLIDYALESRNADLYNRRPSSGSGLITSLGSMGYLGSADMMGLHWHGSHFNAFYKLILGWLDPELFVPNRPSMIKRLPPVYSDPGNALVIRPNVYRYEDELFLVEVRGSRGRDWQGNWIDTDMDLGSDLDNGVFVYHVNTKGYSGGTTSAEVSRAEPFLDLEGEPEGSTQLLALKPGDCLETWQTCFYDGYESGLELEVLSAEDDGTHELRLSWNCNPRLSAVTNADGVTFLFGRDSEGRPVYKVNHGGIWFPSTSDWIHLGGKIEGHPAAMSSGDVHVFVRGQSDEPLTKRFEHPSMEPSSTSWTALGGEVLGMAPLNSFYATTQPYVAVRRVSNRVILMWRRDDEDWASSAAHWFDLGGDVLGSPAIAKDRQGRLHVFARSRSNVPLHKYQDNAGRWQPSPEGWFELGGQIDADPVAIADREDFGVHVFVRGISGRVFYKHWDGRVWIPGSTDWTNLDGQVLGPPVAVQDSDGTIHIFVTGISHQVFHKRLQDGRWYPSQTGWDSLGGQVLDSPAATALGVSEVVDIFVTGTNGEVLQKTWRRGRWISDWISLGTPRPLSFSLRAIASDAGITGDFTVRQLAEHSDIAEGEFTLRELIDIVDP